MIREWLARALNANQHQVWWCAVCHRFEARDDIHDHDEELGGLCRRCVRDGTHTSHAEKGGCWACSWLAHARWPPVRARILAAGVRWLGGMMVCHGCGKWGAPGQYHVDSDPEYRYACESCEMDVYDGPHDWSADCPACVRKHSTEAEAEAARERWMEERREEVRRVHEMFAEGSG